MSICNHIWMFERTAMVYILIETFKVKNFQANSNVCQLKKNISRLWSVYFTVGDYTFVGQLWL